MNLIGSVLAVLLAGAPAGERLKLVFSMDQGFGNGIVINGDVAGATRIIEALKPLQGRYDIYALFNPQLRDPRNLEAMLDLCVKRDLPFVLDVYSSDAMTLGTSTAFNAPHDGPHGVAISLERLAEYKRRYGRHLAGLRFMEIFSQDFTVRAVRTTNPEWNTANWKLPADSFWQPEIARRFLRFAKGQGMFVQWSDWHWSRFADWDRPQRGHEEDVRGLLREFPGVALVTYANNEPDEQSVPRLKTWHEAVAPFLAVGAAGIGLSNQAWLRRDETQCPADDLIAWSGSALDRGAKIIQFEPVWYFFELPRGSFGRSDYTGESQWRQSGLPRPAFRRLAEFLLKRSLPESRPASGPAPRSEPR